MKLIYILTFTSCATSKKENVARADGGLTASVIDKLVGHGQA